MIAPWQTPIASFSVLVDPPVDEPLTLEDAKLRAALDWTSAEPPDPPNARDRLMLDHIAAARSQVERDTGLALLTQTRDVYFVILASGAIALPSQALPLQQIVSVTPIPAPAPSAIGGGYCIASGRLAAGWYATDALAGVTAGVARCVVGWIDPDDLRARDPLLVQAVGLLTAHFATFGRDLVTADTTNIVPLGYDDAIASYRLIWLP